MKARRALAPHLALALLALASLTLVWRQPWQMDEFLQYHVLACHQPGQTLYAFREGCGAFPTKLGPLHFERAYHYTGVTSSLLLWLPYTAWKSLAVPQLLGVLSLALVGLGVAKSLRLPWWSAAFAVLFLPLAYSTIHDAGPVRVGLVVTAWAPVLQRRCFGSARLIESLGWAALLVAVVLVATEDKPFFLFLLPGVAVWCHAVARITEQSSPPAMLPFAALWGTCGSLAAGLLGFMQANGQPYVAYLREAGAAIGTKPSLGGGKAAVLMTSEWSAYLDRIRDQSGFGVWGMEDRLRDLNLADAAPQAGLKPGYQLFALAIALGTVLLYAVAFRQLRRARSRSGLVELLVAAALLAAGAWAAGGWAGHHFVYAQVPLFALVVLVGARRVLLVSLALAALGAGSLGLSRAAPLYPWAGNEVRPVLAAVTAQVQDDEVLECGSWGCYFPATLLAPKGRPVAFAMQRWQVLELSKAARARSERVVHACFDCDQGTVGALYPAASVEPLPCDGCRRWRLFRVSWAGR
jgi:hypothetical protein